MIRIGRFVWFLFELSALYRGLDSQNGVVLVCHAFGCAWSLGV